MNKQTTHSVVLAILTMLVLANNAKAEQDSRAIEQDLALGADADVKHQRSILTEEGHATSDLFGTQGGYFHPYLSLSETYSDNIYTTNDQTKSDFITTLSPGLFMAYPGTKDIPPDSFATSNISPGGLLAAREKVDYFQRFQSSLLYQADVEKYIDNTSADQTHQRLEGLGQFNLKGGVTLDLAGEYKRSADSPSDAPKRSEFTSEVVDASVYVELGKKIDLAVNARSFNLDYDDAVNHLYDRNDQSYSARLQYEYSNITKFFAKYRLTKVDYEVATLTNKDISDLGVGLKWGVTSKSACELEAGYQWLSFPSSSMEDSSDMAFRILLAHHFSPRTSLKLTATRGINESSMVGTNYVLNHQASVQYIQKLGTKFYANLDLSYSKDAYDTQINTATGLIKRKDYTLMLSPSLDYRMKEWFIISAGYSLADLNSNIDFYDYTTNIFSFRLTGYL